MIEILKNRRETILFAVSVVLFVIVIFFTLRSIRGLTKTISGATDLDVLRASSEPVTFNLEKFESFGLEF